MLLTIVMNESHTIAPEQKLMIDDKFSSASINYKFIPSIGIPLNLQEQISVELYTKILQKERVLLLSPIPLILCRVTYLVTLDPQSPRHSLYLMCRGTKLRFEGWTIVEIF